MTTGRAVQRIERAADHRARLIPIQNPCDDQCTKDAADGLVFSVLANILRVDAFGFYGKCYVDSLFAFIAQQRFCVGRSTYI